MVNKLVTMGLIVIVVLFMTATYAIAQDTFTRSQEIPFPEANLNYGGTGNMISGVDLDEDGNIRNLQIKQSCHARGITAIEDYPGGFVQNRKTERR